MSSQIWRTTGTSAGILLIIIQLFSSCSWYRETDFSLYDAVHNEAVLKTDSKAAVTGKIHSDKEKLFRYRLEQELTVPDFYSLELHYRIEEQDTKQDSEVLNQFVLRIPNEQAWVLPQSAEFLGMERSYSSIRYSIPLSQSVFSEFTLSVEPQTPDAVLSRTGDVAFKGPSPALILIHIKLVPRFFGYTFIEDSISLTPYVYSDDSGIEPVLWINPAESYMSGIQAELIVDYSDTDIVPETVFVNLSSVVYEYIPSSRGPLGALRFGPGNSNGTIIPFQLQSRHFPESLIIAEIPDRAFPLVPVPAEPAQILSYKQAEWRDERYELFAWNNFPSVLILDTRDYTVQSRMLKRLAFFVEKAEFRGRLARDEEIAYLHGWNAHDYRATDLAAFFETARRTNFPLSTEELELQTILLANRILIQDETGTISAGSGALVSISRESTETLRSLFMAHEGYHGLFFIDEDFRAFAQYRWESMDEDAKNFLRAYFDYLKYDINDEYLMKNELMAYSLQQHPSQASRYFGTILAGRLKSKPEYAAALEPFNEVEGHWRELGQLFTAEAEAFSSYVRQRWGLTGGRIWQLYQRSRSKESR